MKKWMTKEEYKWLAARFPRWYKRREREERGFIKKTTAEFLAMFPTHKDIRQKLESVSIHFVIFPPTQLLTRV